MNSLPPALPQDLDYPAPMPNEGPSRTDPRIRLQKFLTALGKFWWVPLLTLVLCVGAGVLVFIYLPPIFVSYAQLWETEKLKLPEGATFTEDPETYVGTLREVLQSGTMNQNALQIIQLAGTNIPVADPSGKPFEVKISLVQAPKSSVFLVEADSSNPAFTRAYLNALISAYREYKQMVRKEVSGDTLASISDQVKRLERDLQAGQDALAEFEQSNNFAVLQQENEIAGGYLAKMKTQLADYELQDRLLDAVALEKESNLTGATNSTSSLFDSLHDTTSAATPSTESQSAFRDIAVLTAQRDRLSKYLRPQHPKIVKLDADIALSQRLIDLYHRQNQQQIDQSRQALQIRINGERKAISDWEAKVAYANSRLVEFERLKVSVARKEALYERLVSMLQNVDISRNIDQETLTVLEPASNATRSYKTALIILAMSVMGGLASGFGLVFLAAWRDDRIVSLVEVCEQITDNVVGQVPEIKQLKSGAPLGILESNDDRHMYVESYRSLRSALLYLTSASERPKVILVTSAMPNEGKSTIATNLARILALGGARVLLVDGDLRKGQLHDLLGLQPKPGFSDFLRGTEDFDKIVQASSLPNLSFISRGTNLHNSGDLLIGPAFDQFLLRGRQQFDHVIMDTSPVFATGDATTIAPKVDGTLFVVRSHFSRTSMVKEALELLYRRQAPVIGLIVNRANSSDQSYHYYKDAKYYASATTDETAAAK
jgi:capsular exopolysaccharide synthesis family protein